jgi:hypothetical protein
MFLFFVIDIVRWMVDNVQIKLFADDAKIYNFIDNGNLNLGQLKHKLGLVVSLGRTLAT